MPRTARQQSQTNIYHIMLRGINRQDIFLDDADCLRFIEILGECKQLSEFQLYAFCLMSNHVHLLLKVGNEPLETIFRRLGTRFVSWYNTKYNRIGHLFQDRYKSENVDDQQYFLTVLRYIIQNPMKAGLETTPGTYRWSSFRAYLEEKGSITDISLALQIAGSHTNLINYLKTPNNNQALEISNFTEHITDKEAESILISELKLRSSSSLRSLPFDEQTALVREMHKQGASPVQIIRLTGMAKATVYKYIKH